MSDKISHYILWGTNHSQYQALGSFRDREELDKLKKSISVIPGSVIPNAAYKIMAVRYDETNEFVEENSVRTIMEYSR